MRSRVLLVALVVGLGQPVWAQVGASAFAQGRSHLSINVGGLYKHTFYDTLKDRDSAGGRAGLTTPISEHAYLSAGVVYESYFSCNSSLYDKCSQVYPEFSLSFSY